MPRTTPTTGRMMSVREAAQHFGVAPKTIRRRIADGTITAYRLGPRIIRVDLDDLHEAMRRIPTAAGA